MTAAIRNEELPGTGPGLGTSPMAAVRAALTHLAAGGMIVVADDEDRENEGDLVMSADVITKAQMTFMLRHGSGIVCVPMLAERADALGLDLMVDTNTDQYGTAFTVTVDAYNTGTGISATDRLTTVRALADPESTVASFRRPGHIFPLRALPGGVLKRSGHTEASVDLVRLAGRGEVAVITELVGDDGVPTSGADLVAFAAAHQLPYITVADLIRFRRRTEKLVVETGAAEMPTAHGAFRAFSFRSEVDGIEHLALTMGDIAAADKAAAGVLVRVHSECLTGDVFGSARCDCGNQLEQSMTLIAAEGCGVIVYLRGHEGRGIGIGHKLQAYRLQELGRDTVDANSDLGLPVDGREYGIGASILSELGVHRVRLITNNPHKYGGLAGFDLELVSRVSQRAHVTADNLRYLTTKRDRMGHDLDLP